MANAKKCDRCGELYESPICNDIVQITVDYGYSGGEQKFDLCDKCYEELIKWRILKMLVPNERNYKAEDKE